MRWRRVSPEGTRAAVEALELPAAVFKTCPWEPRELVQMGLRQWLRCAGAALRDDQVIGMPSHAVDEAGHGLILCTARYASFCGAAYGRFLHHHPDGTRGGDPMAAQLRRRRPGRRLMVTARALNRSLLERQRTRVVFS